MKKKNAWTLIELFMAMSVIILIASFLITTFRPNVQRAKLYTYATIINLIKGTIAVMEKYQSDPDSEPKTLSYQNPDSTDDTFCIEFADNFTLSEAADCSKDALISDINLKFPNGVTVQGLANPWKKPYVTSSYMFKNIIIDIDGEEGLNKIWIDRFPLRIYEGAKYDGTIYPVNCADDSVYDDEGNKITLDDSTGKSPYCKQKFNASGANVNKNFLMDDKVITYDIYKAAATGEQTKATLVASAQSPAAADCMAYGGNGYHSREECAQFGVKIHTQCASSATCEGCGSVSPSICPMDSTQTTQTDQTGCLEIAKANQIDDTDVRCITLQHKPGSGLSYLVESLVGEIDQ